MINSNVGIGGVYMISTSKDSGLCVHSFDVGELVIIIERVHKTGFSAQSVKTGRLQFIEASDLHSEAKKEVFNTTVSEDDMRRVLSVKRSGVCNMLSPIVRELAFITKEQHIEIIRNFGKIKDHYNL